MRTVLVTGGTGFVGGHTLDALTARGDVRVVAACRDRRRLPPGFDGEVREGDLRDPGYRETVLDGIDVVCHAAIWTSLWGHKGETRRLYLEPTLAFLALAIERGVDRFVNISTTSAAAPLRSADAMSRGVKPDFWPHLCSVVSVEDAMRASAGSGCTMVNLRFGIFTGPRCGISLLPILLPRLKTHLVPWVRGGRTSMPLIDGRDVGRAMALAAVVPGLTGYEAFNVVGPEIPTVRGVIAFLHDRYGYPQPHFGVPFAAAYPFAWLMEKLDSLVPWSPLITRSIVHLIEEVNVNNDGATSRLGYTPRVHWQDSIAAQIEEIGSRRGQPAPLSRPVT